jgi:fatty acid desaturase
LRNGHLECLVHEGSHCNWSRNHRLNDALTDLLAALPVFSRVADYRKGHRTHHLQFGTDNDIDRRRYLRLGIGWLDRSSLLGYWRGARLGQYVLGWWRAIGLNGKALLGGIAWHLTLVVLPLACLVGVRAGLALWASYWLLPMAVVLPPIRFVAEAGKHRYEGNETEFEATISNLGMIHSLLFHPHGDGHHVLHHMDPGIPFFNLARAHRGLMELDPSGYGARHRVRTRVLQEP